MSAETDWLEGRSRISPTKTAVVEGETGVRWSYSQLNDRATNLAHYFLNNGVQKGDRVALLSPNHISYFDLLFACGKIGAIFVPLNWRLSIPELSYILNDSNPKLFACHSQMEIAVNGLPVSNKLIVDDAKYETIVSHDGKKVDIVVESEDPLLIIYTGGTTGKPKGVVLPHRAVIWNGLNTILSWNLHESDITLTYLPMFHTGGLNALSIPVLQVGGTVVVGKDFEPEAAIELIEKEQCTIVLMVPTMYHLIIQTERFTHTTFPSMHTFLSGGAPCPLSIYEPFVKKGLTFKEGYGLTEAGPNNFYMDPSLVKMKRGSVGRTMMFNETKIIGDHGEALLPGQVGEIVIRGNHVFSHYWNNEDETNKTLLNGWLYTGDLGRMDEDGFYYIVGRKKDMIISGGENVYPLEVEHLICQHPSVSEAVVVGLPNEKWGEMVAAVVVLNPNEVLTFEQLQDFCRDQIAKYKIPKRLIIVDQLPKTHVGKIDKKEIVRLYA